jgi:hypothetical protein
MKNKWWECFDKLFYEDNGDSFIESDISSIDLDSHFVHEIQELKVKDASKR